MLGPGAIDDLRGFALYRSLVPLFGVFDGGGNRVIEQNGRLKFLFDSGKGTVHP